MGGESPAAREQSAEVERMRASAQSWVARAAHEGAHGLRDMPPAVLLSLLTAATVSPLVATVAGLSAVVTAVGGILSGLGGGVLSGLLTEVVQDQGKKQKTTQTANGQGQGDVQQQLADKISVVLQTGGNSARYLRSEIAELLRHVDIGSAALTVALEEGNEYVRTDILSAIGALGTDFDELQFLLNDIAQAAGDIQQDLDAQGASIRVIIEQNERHSTDIRLVRDMLRAQVRRAEASTAPIQASTVVPPSWLDGCPYRGLLPFDQEHADVFYGRERLTAELTTQLAAQLTLGGPLIVTGASGAGKSSLLRAGLLPKLADGTQVPGSQDWPRIVMTPTRDPLTELATRLAALCGITVQAVREHLASHPDQAHQTAWQAVLTALQGLNEPSLGPGRLVLVIDQFEELFTLPAGPGAEADRRAFISAITAAAATPVGAVNQPPAIVVIAVRGDYWDRCAAYPELASTLRGGQFVVGPMTESELRLAITGPAETAGLQVEHALTEAVLGDLRTAGGNTAGVLPLLSQSMALTWEQREGDRLTSHGYGLTGGVAAAVQVSADRAYETLPAERQPLVREIFRAMTVADHDGRLARRPVAQADLYEMFPATPRSEIDAVLEHFAASRLLVLDDENVEISHDALLREWPRLRAWLEDDRADWALRGQLADDAGTWQASKNDPSFLYRGTQLAAVTKAVAGWKASPARYPALGNAQQDFLNASARAAARSTRVRRGAVAVLAVLALVASGAAGYANDQAHRAKQATGIADQRLSQANFNQVTAEAQQLTSTNAVLAADLDLAALHMPQVSPQQTADLTTRLISMENTPLPVTMKAGVGGPVNSVAASHDGRLLATASPSGTVQLWDITGVGHARRAGRPFVGISAKGESLQAKAALAPNGRTLVVASPADGFFEVWDISDPTLPQELSYPTITPNNTAGGNAIAISADSRILAVGGDDGNIYLWDLADPARPRHRGTIADSTSNGVTVVAFSPNGATLAAGGNDGVIRLWNVSDPAKPVPIGRPLTAGTNASDTGVPPAYGIAWVRSLAFSPNGKLLASGDNDDTLRIWNVSHPAKPELASQPSLANRNVIFSVAFSPDSEVLAAAGYNDTIQLWNATDPTNPLPLGQPLAGDTGANYSVTFDADGMLVSGTQDGTLRLWPLPPTLLTGPASLVPTVTIGTSERKGTRLLAAGSWDGTIRLWNLANPSLPQPVGPVLVPAAGIDPVFQIAFSPNGQELAAGSTKGNVWLWDVHDPAHPRLQSPGLGTGPLPVLAVAFSPDGATLAAGTLSGEIWLWDISDPGRPRQIRRLLDASYSPAARSLAFSPNGHLLASGDDSGNIQLWDVTTPADARQAGKPIPDSTEPVVSLVFAKNSQTLMAGNYDGTVRLWNAAAAPGETSALGKPLIANNNNNIGSVQSVALSPNGRWLVAGYASGAVEVWGVGKLSDPQEIGQPLTADAIDVESLAFSADSQWLVTGNADDTVQLYNLDVNDAIAHVCSAGNALTPQLWHKYIPQLPYRPVCPTHN